MSIEFFSSLSVACCLVLLKTSNYYYSLPLLQIYFADLHLYVLKNSGALPLLLYVDVMEHIWIFMRKSGNYNSGRGFFFSYLLLLLAKCALCSLFFLFCIFMLK